VSLQHHGFAATKALEGFVQTVGNQNRKRCQTYVRSVPFGARKVDRGIK
jgi:hypothetical protein